MNFCVVALPSIVCEELEVVSIHTYDILLAVPLTHHLAKGYKLPKANKDLPEISLKDIGTEPLILMKDAGIGGVVLKAFKNVNIKPNVVFEVSTLDIAYHFVEAGNGLSFIFDQQINRNLKQNKVAYFKIKECSLKGSVSFGYKKDKELNVVERTFLEILQQEA